MTEMGFRVKKLMQSIFEYLTFLNFSLFICIMMIIMCCLKDCCKDQTMEMDENAQHRT
jgi:hypothetical protein